ncbi:MAG: electron transfer flavoprotein-ubiquinone oxidoreductase, partial [Alphaproteobacteria bacterium]|nr:electron transfer flavoprotein-ubiquinone oxidoreductase [Alphaproteobacteria bacterium]
MPLPVRSDRECMEYDVVIVGGGPAGLSCAIRLKQIKPDVSVCVLEKGSEIGAHLLSGAVFETRALDELIPDWKESAGKEGGAPLTVKAQDDRFLFLTKTKSFRLPTPPQMHNHGNYIISLGLLGRWLAQQAEALGVEIYPGFAAAEVLYNEQNAVIGVATGDMGIDRTGERTAQFQPGMELHARQTVFAEGCHGSLTKTLIAKYDLRKNSNPQTYGLGIKELWEIPADKHKPGLIVHTIGWPVDTATYGGSWLYHLDNNMVSIGYVVGLDYQNPWLSPFEEMQRMKTHPAIRTYLEGGRRVAYGARALVEGGFQSLPQLTFAGGLLIGDTAGFLNVPKIKGNHMAMKSGMVAAESLAAMLEGAGYGAECLSYPDRLKQSWMWRELYQVRNIRPGFHFGLWFGLLHAAFQTWGGWRLPYTLKNHADHSQMKKAADVAKIEYPRPDGVLTFDRLTSVRLSNTMHEDGQPVHLKLRDASVPLTINLPEYAEPAQRYCPAGVYEVVAQEGQNRFVINSQNCVHCKTCDIKDPSQNIDWTVPQGGGG